MPKFEINFLDDYSDKSLLDEIRRVAASNQDAPLSSDAFDRFSQRVSASTIRRRFGSWQNALTQAGFARLYSGRKVSLKMKEQPAKRLSKDDLIADLQRVNRLVGKNFLTVSEFNAHSISSCEAVRRRFGSWANGLKAAGIAQSELANKNWSDEQCFENLATVWTHYGRTPAYRNMFSIPSVINGKAYEARWGTWRKAIRAFVTWAGTDANASAVESIEPPDQVIEEKPSVIRRAEEDQRQVGPRLRFRIFQRDRFRCVACGRSPATELKIILHADHIKPVALGGKTSLENLQTLCESCNLGKGKLPG